MTFTISNLSPEVYDRVRAIADRVNLTVEDAVEVAIRNSLDHHAEEVVNQAAALALVQRMGRMRRGATSNAALAHDAGRTSSEVQPASGLEPLVSEGIPAPFDLELSGPCEKVIPREAGEPKLEFWFDEDKAAS